MSRLGRRPTLRSIVSRCRRVFPLWGEKSTLLTLDAGLIKINDINDWTSQAFGIGEIGEVFDATEHSVTLDIIGCPVRAFGGATGVIEGDVRALFFRYEVQGGQEYATDVLIGPRRNDNGARIKRPTVEHPSPVPAIPERSGSTIRRRNLGPTMVTKTSASPRKPPRKAYELAVCALSPCSGVANAYWHRMGLGVPTRWDHFSPVFADRSMWKLFATGA